MDWNVSLDPLPLRYLKLFVMFSTRPLLSEVMLLLSHYFPTVFLYSQTGQMVPFHLKTTLIIFLISEFPNSSLQLYSFYTFSSTMSYISFMNSSLTI